jgi:glycosyltransferase involved in cell wall biosynthesis
LPIVATIHHAVHHPDARAYKGTVRAAYHRWWIAPNERRVMRRVDRIVAVSRFVAETARATLVDVPIQIIYNGVDTDKFRPDNHQRKAGEPFRLLYVGSWMARKGVDLLAPIMRELGSGFELRYTGGRANHRAATSMQTNMRAVGRLSSAEIIAEMQAADALLFPSRSEGFGLVAAEAMACGLPVIATCGSSVEEVVEDNVTGMLCTKNDVNAFVVAAASLEHDRDNWYKMSHAARARAVGHFSIEEMIDAYILTYSESILR